MLYNEVGKRFNEEIESLKKFLTKDLVKDVLTLESDNWLLSGLKASDKLLNKLGYLDNQTYKFTPYSMDEIAKILDKDLEPKLFYVRDYNKSRNYHINLPYYQYTILFKFGNNYYEHCPKYDSNDFIKTIKDFFKCPNNFIHVTNTYESKPNKEGNTYRIEIYKKEEYDRWSKDFYYTIQLNLREIIKGKGYDISKMELDDLIETFEITNKEVIDFIKECFDNDGLICETNELVTYNGYGEFVYIPKKDEINALYTKLDNLKKSITFVEPKKLQSNLRYIEED